MGSQGQAKNETEYNQQYRDEYARKYISGNGQYDKQGQQAKGDYQKYYQKYTGNQNSAQGGDYHKYSAKYAGDYASYSDKYTQSSGPAHASYDKYVQQKGSY